MPVCAKCVECVQSFENRKKNLLIMDNSKEDLERKLTGKDPGRKLNGIYSTNAYEDFIPNPLFANVDRINYFIWMFEEDNSFQLPLVEVVYTASGLKIVGDQDSYLASQSLKLPIDFYFSHDPNPKEKKFKLNINPEVRRDFERWLITGEY